MAAASGEPPPPGVDANSTSGRDEPGSSTFTPSQTFAYDAAGNRLEVTDNGMTTKYQPNAANQYEQIVTGTEIVEPQFDPLGNLLQDDRNTYTWDSDIHLLSVSTMSKERPGTKNQEQRTEFRYDPLHRRVARLENQSELTLFTHDGWNVIQEHSGNVKFETSNLKRSARHTWGEDLSGTLQGAGGVGGLLGTIHNVAKTKTQEQEIASWFHYDSNGNVILLTDVAGDASARYAYDAFGQTLTGTGIAADLNQYRFSTKPIESGSGLAYYGYRYYDPVSGRWPSRDPIMEKGGINLYFAASNSLVNLIDRFGLDFGDPPYPQEPDPTDLRPDDPAGCPPGQAKDENCVNEANKDYNRNMEDLSNGVSFTIGCELVAGAFGGPLGMGIALGTVVGTLLYEGYQANVYFERRNEDIGDCPCVDAPLL